MSDNTVKIENISEGDEIEEIMKCLATVGAEICQPQDVIEEVETTKPVAKNNRKRKASGRLPDDIATVSASSEGKEQRNKSVAKRKKLETRTSQAKKETVTTDSKGNGNADESDCSDNNTLDNEEETDGGEAFELFSCCHKNCKQSFVACIQPDTKTFLCLKHFTKGVPWKKTSGKNRVVVSSSDESDDEESETSPKKSQKKMVSSIAIQVSPEDFMNVQEESDASSSASVNVSEIPMNIGDYFVTSGSTEIIAEYHPEGTLISIPSAKTKRTEETQNSSQPEDETPRKQKKVVIRDIDVKTNRNLGISYVTPKSLRIMPSKRELKPPCDGTACESHGFYCTMFDEAERQRIINMYWDMGDLQKHREWINDHILATEGSGSQKKQAVVFFLPRHNPITGLERPVRVCKQMFLSTIGETERQLRTTLDKTVDGVVKPDSRGGRHESQRMRDEIRRTKVVAFMETIPKVETPNGPLFSWHWNINKLRALYNQQHPYVQVSKSFFRKTFREQNIDFEPTPDYAKKTKKQKEFIKPLIPKRELMQK